MTARDDRTAEQRGRDEREAQRVQALDVIASDVAHGFNNVLAVVRGNLEHIAHRLASGPIDQQLLSECVDEMLHATERADELVQQLQRAALPADASRLADEGIDRG